MKKFLSCLLASAMLVTALPAIAFAANDAALEQAIITVKSKIDIPAEYTEFQSNIYTEELGDQYELTWTTAPNDFEDMKRIYVTANNHGDIISYNSSERRYTNDIQFAKFTGEEMKEKAQAWLTQVNPSWMEQLPEDAIDYPERGSVYSQMDSISFERHVNGLPFCNNFVNVMVDNRTGEINSMYADWTYLTDIPAVENAISVENAEKSFLEKSPIELHYQRTDDSENAVLVYQPANPHLRLNGQTGEEFVPFSDYSRLSGGAGNIAAYASADAESKEDSLTPAEIKNITEVAGLLSESELRKIAEGLENTGIAEADFRSINYQNEVNWDDKEKTSEYSASLSYIKDGEEIDSQTYFHIYLDAMTGKLNGYDSYPRNYDTKDAEVTYEEAIANAQAFGQLYAADEFQASKIQEQDKELEKYDYNISFTRHENDIPFDNNFINITVDKLTGRIISFHQNWDDEITFESPEGVLGADRAGELLMEKAGMHLSYALAQDGENKTPAVELMYQLDPEIPYFIGAKTGDLQSYGGHIYDPTEPKISLPGDLDGHYAQVHVNALIESGILTLDENETNFRPDEAINQKDLLAFVSGLKMGYIPYLVDEYSIMKTAKRYGLITEPIDPEAIATREDGVVFIIRALDYDNIAKLTDIFNTNFADEDQITNGRNGYVALARGFGVIAGDENNNFNPQESLSRGDAAIMIYNYLAK